MMALLCMKLFKPAIQMRSQTEISRSTKLISCRFRFLYMMVHTHMNYTRDTCLSIAIDSNKRHTVSLIYRTFIVCELIAYLIRSTITSDVSHKTS